RGEARGILVHRRLLRTEIRFPARDFPLRGGNPRLPCLEILGRCRDTHLFHGQSARGLLKLGNVRLRILLRLLGYRPSLIKGSLLRGEIRRLPFRRSFGFLRDQSASLRLGNEPFGLLSLLPGRVPRRLKLFQLFGSPRGPRGAFRFERLTSTKDSVLCM